MRINPGRDHGSDGVVHTEPALVSRLTLVTTVKAGDWAVELPHPLFLRSGQHVWVVGPAVFIQQPGGDVTRHEGDGFWLCR